MKIRTGTRGGRQSLFSLAGLADENMAGTRVASTTAEGIIVGQPANENRFKNVRRAGQYLLTSAYLCGR